MACHLWRRKASIWANSGLLSIETLGTNLSEILINSNIFCHENSFENVIWEMVAILSRAQKNVLNTTSKNYCSLPVYVSCQDR